MAMNKKLKAEWIKALRSGKYVQTNEVLQADEKSFCCLGVLCVVAEKLGEFEPIRDGGLLAGNDLSDQVSCGSMHFSIDQDMHDALICMNDGHRRPQRSFKQIANWIEKHVVATSTRI